MDLVIQTYLAGEWHDSMEISVDGATAGHNASTVSAYEIDYWRQHIDGDAVIDDRAVSVAAPVDIGRVHLPTWPAFLLDMMPQGEARDRLAAQYGPAGYTPKLDLTLLIHAAGSPIGNLRVENVYPRPRPGPGIRESAISDRKEPFLELMRRFTLLAPGSTGIGGVWPKVMLTRSHRDDLFYPDSLLPDEDAVEHVIVKTTGAAPGDIEHLILKSEPPYLEVARAFGIRCGKPLRDLKGSILIPRFDRSVNDGQVLRFGQESLVSASGKTIFGYTTTHQEYLAVIARYCAEPITEIVEYVMRDMLATVMGDSDNHGRNTALQKRRNHIALTPLFDFAPMKVDRRGIVRSTTWGGVQRHPPSAGDVRTICEAATTDIDMTPQALLDILKAKVPMYRAVREIAQTHGVPDEIIRRAIDGEPLAAAIESA